MTHAEHHETHSERHASGSSSRRFHSELNTEPRSTHTTHHLATDVAQSVHSTGMHQLDAQLPNVHLSAHPQSINGVPPESPFRFPPIPGFKSITQINSQVESQEADRLIRAHPGVSAQRVAAVKSALLHSPESVKDKIFANHTVINIYANVQQYNADHPDQPLDPRKELPYGLYNGPHEVSLFSTAPVLHEAAAHEFAHVLDNTDGTKHGDTITGSPGFKRAFAEDYAKLTPRQRKELRNLPIEFEDGPQFPNAKAPHHIGTGDIYAEMVTYLAGEDQTGTGKELSKLLPHTFAYVKADVGTGTGPYKASLPPPSDPGAGLGSLTAKLTSPG